VWYIKPSIPEQIPKEILDIICDDIRYWQNKLQLIADQHIEQPEVVITYFQPELKKDGGAYVTITGIVKKKIVKIEMLL